jgi:hypothetical protein
MADRRLNGVDESATPRQLHLREGGPVIPRARTAHPIPRVAHFADSSSRPDGR